MDINKRNNSVLNIYDINHDFYDNSENINKNYGKTFIDNVIKKPNNSYGNTFQELDIDHNDNDKKLKDTILKGKLNPSEKKIPIFTFDNSVLSPNDISIVAENHYILQDEVKFSFIDAFDDPINSNVMKESESGGIIDSAAQYIDPAKRTNAMYYSNISFDEDLSDYGINCKLNVKFITEDILKYYNFGVDPTSKNPYLKVEITPNNENSFPALRCIINKSGKILKYLKQDGSVDKQKKDIFGLNIDGITMENILDKAAKYNIKLDPASEAQTTISLERRFFAGNRTKNTFINFIAAIVNKDDDKKLLTTADNIKEYVNNNISEII